MEKRSHARVAVAVNARLVVRGEEIEFSVRDVSQGGIFLYTKNPPGRVGDVFLLKLALTAGIKTAMVRAEIVRVVMDTDDRSDEILGIGLHYVDVTAEQEQALTDMLDRAMLGAGTMSRAFPRVYYLLDVGCRTTSELKAIMRDIGEGGVGLTVDRRMEVNEEVEVEITRSGETALKLPGWVVSCEPVSSKALEFRVGVRFARLGPARAELNAFIQKLYRTKSR